MLQGSLGAVSPTEEFECSCGIDPSIKIKYHPVKKMHNASKGWMSKSEQSDFDQRITVTNTRQRLITIRVTDHLPESSDNAIKVRVAVTYFTQNYGTRYLLQSCKASLMVNKIIHDFVCTYVHRTPAREFYPIKIYAASTCLCRARDVTAGVYR